MGRYGSSAVYDAADTLYGIALATAAGTTTSSGSAVASVTNSVVASGTTTSSGSASLVRLRTAAGSTSSSGVATASVTQLDSASGTTSSSGTATVNRFYRLNNTKFTIITLPVGATIITDATGKPVTQFTNSSGANGAAVFLQDSAGNIVILDTTEYNADYIVDENGFSRYRSHHFSIVPWDIYSQITGQDRGNSPLGAKAAYAVIDNQKGLMSDVVEASELNTRYQLLTNLAYSE